MGNFARRFIAFVLGMVVMLVTLLGGTAGALYWAFKNLSLSKVGVMQEDESGLGDATVEELVALIIAAQTDPESFTIQKLEEQGIDVLKLLSGLGVDFSKADEVDYNSIKGISPLLLFSSSGLNEISFSTVFALLPKGEDGLYPLFSEGARNMLRGYSLGYLLSTDETTGQMRLFTEISGLKIGSLFPKTFTETYSAEKSEYVYSATSPALAKLGNLKLSLITSTATGENVFDLGYELNEGELKEIGDTMLVDFLADLIAGEDETAKAETKQSLALFDGIMVKELFVYSFDDGGYIFNAEILFAGFSIGTLLGYTSCTLNERCPIHEDATNCDGKWYEKCDGTTSCPVHKGENCEDSSIKYIEFKPEDAEGLITKNLIYLGIEDLFAGGIDVSTLVGGVYLGHSLGYKMATAVPLTYCAKNCAMEHEHTYYWVDASDEYVGALFNKFANITLESAVSGSVDLEDIVETSYLGDLLGKYKKDGVWYDDSDCTIKTPSTTPMDKIMLSIYDKTMTDISSGSGLRIEDMLAGIKMGEFMGYALCSQNEDCQIHTNVADCDGKWYEEQEGGNFVVYEPDDAEGLITKNLINISIDDIFAGSFEITSLVDGIYLGHSLGYKMATTAPTGYCVKDCAETHEHTFYWIGENSEFVGSLFNEFANVALEQAILGSVDLEGIVETSYLGDLLGKYKKDGVWYEDSDCTIKTSSATAMDKIMLSIYDKTMADISNGTGLKLEEMLAGIKMGELMGHEFDGVWKDSNGNALKIDKFDEALYNVEVSKLVDGTMDFKEVLDGLKLGELMGNTYSGGVWKDGNGAPLTLDKFDLSLYNVEVSKLLDGKIDFKEVLDGLKLGELMGNTYSGGVWKDGSNVVLTLDKFDAALYNVEVTKLLNGEIDFKEVLNGLYVGELMGNTYEDGVWYDENGAVLTLDKFDSALYGIDAFKLLNGQVEFREVLNGLYVGELMGNSYDGGVWKDKNGALLTLDVLDATIYQVAVSDLLNNSVDFKVVLGDLYVGDLMGYTGGVGAWKNGGVAVSNLDMVMADVKLEEIFNNSFDFKSKINTLTLGDIIDVNASGTPTILKLLGASKVGELSSDINSMYLGEVMGYTKCSNSAQCTVHAGGTGCNGKWYKGSTAVTGLNAKIANYTFSSFASSGFNAKEFTLGDVITQDSEFTSGIFSLLDVGSVEGAQELQGATDLEKRKNIPVGDVSKRTQSGVKKATLQELMDCGMFTLTTDEQAKLTGAFTLAGKGDWKALTMQQFISTIIGMIGG